MNTQTSLPSRPLLSWSAAARINVHLFLSMLHQPLHTTHQHQRQSYMNHSRTYYQSKTRQQKHISDLVVFGSGHLGPESRSE